MTEQTKRAEYKRQWYEKNKDRLRERSKIYREQHRDELIQKKREYYEANKDQINERRRATGSYQREYDKKRYWENREAILAERKEFYHNNKELMAARYKKSYEKNKEKREVARKGNQQKIISSNLRCRVKAAVKGGSKSASTMELVGCTIEQLMIYLESKWLPEMSWDNYGSLPDGTRPTDKVWQIDHIQPCISFNLLIVEDQKKCFHYTNLQPLWAKDNLSKGGKLV